MPPSTCSRCCSHVIAALGIAYAGASCVCAGATWPAPSAFGPCPWRSWPDGQCGGETPGPGFIDASSAA
jgi:hypothetical protein